MAFIKVYIERHTILIYFALTFIISWGGILIVVGPSGIPGKPDQIETLLPTVIMEMLAGPCVAGLLLTGLIYGRAGFQELFSQVIKWRVNLRWYAISILTAPLLMTVIPLVASLLYPEFLPGIITKSEKASILIMGLSAGLVAGIFEEIGWTGFAIPKLRLKYNAIATGLIVGFLWGAWHFLVNFWSSGGPFGELSLSLLLHSLIFSIGILPAYRVLIIWIYDKSSSLFVVIIAHLSLTASNVIFVPKSIAGGIGPAWSFILAVALWLIIATLSLKKSVKLTEDATI